MIDKEAFLKAVLPESQVDLHGQTVTVRGLSRHEVVALQRHKEDLPLLEQAILRLGLVDPALSDDEVAGWYEGAPSGDIDKVIGAISDLSGMTQPDPAAGVPGSSKSGIPRIRDERRT